MKTVLSVKDFSLLYHLVIDSITRMEYPTYYALFDLTEKEKIEKKKRKEENLKNDKYYQDLLRLREALGNLQVEVETPKVEIEQLKENADD